MPKPPWFVLIGLVLAATTLLIAFHAGASPPPSLPDEAVAAKLLEVAGEGFRIRKTEHFAICYDTPPEVLWPLIGRLEGTYNAITRFCDGIGFGVEPPTERLGVIFFDRHEDYERYCGSFGMSAETTAGFYHQQNNLAAFGNMLNTPQLREINAEIDRALEKMKQLRRDGSRASRERRDELRRGTSALRLQRDAVVERFNRFVLQHEAAHQMFFNFGVHTRGAENPLWLVEGLACQFEVPQSRAARGLGRINHMRLADLRDAVGVSLRVDRISGEDLEAAFASNRLVRLRDLVSDPDRFTGDDVMFRYAQAWGLVYYLARKHHEPFAAYLREVAARKPGVVVGAKGEIDAFESCFGPLDASFEQAWVDYMLELPLDRREAGR